MSSRTRSIAVSLTLLVVLNSAPGVLAQAGRYIPFPRIPFPRAPIPHFSPGGGRTHILPHVPIHGGDDTIFWAIVVILGTLALVFCGWHLGQAIGGRLTTVPKISTSSWRRDPTTWRTVAVPTLPDLILQPSQVAEKTEQTHRLMAFLSRKDSAFDPVSLREWSSKTFVLVQKAWEARDYCTVKERLMPAILVQHEDMLRSMRENHQINRIEDLRIDELEFVHLHCPQCADARVVTAIITFCARVYFVDDRTGAYTRGLSRLSRFQEFWSFRRQGGGWLLQEIENSRESNRLKLPNFVAELTDQQLVTAQSGLA